MSAPAEPGGSRPPVEERLAALRADRQRGSAALADEALGILAQAADEAPEQGFLSALGDVARALAGARPAMVAIENRMHQVMANLHAAHAPEAALRGIAASLCATLQDRAPAERGAAARAACATLDATAVRRVLTVSWSDTVALALQALAQGRALEVLVPQGAPLLDGQRAAERLASQGLQVTLLPDAGMGWAAARADVGLVGADAVLGDGAVVNRASTRLAALALRAGGKPLWAVCEAAKVTWRAGVPLEEGDPRQVAVPAEAAEGRLHVVHPLFEATPPDLVAGVCTELGPLGAEALRDLAARHQRRAAWAGAEPGP